MKLRLVGLKAATDAWAAALREEGYDEPPANARVITEGEVDASAVDRWVGVEPIESGWVMLPAPIPVEGNTPGKWLHFAGGRHANTSDLMAMVIPE